MNVFFPLSFLFWRIISAWSRLFRITGTRTNPTSCPEIPPRTSVENLTKASEPSERMPVENKNNSPNEDDFSRWDEDLDEDWESGTMEPGCLDMNNTNETTNNTNSNNNNNNRDMVKYRGNWYRLSKGFGKYHPGGSDTLERFRGRDVSRTMHRWNHSKAAFAFLKQYSQQEDLVDWSKPLVWQVGKLGKKYHDWIQEPVDRPMILFGHPVLEAASKTNMMMVICYWTPIVFMFMFANWYHLTNTYSMPAGESLKSCLYCFALGFVMWPFMEYLIHRWFFHAKPPSNSPLLITLHFLAHGLHHKFPFDRWRLMFPPAPASIIFSFMYLAYYFVFPSWMLNAIGAGTISGYMCYDMMHFYLHYGSPTEGTYLYHMKRYHNDHHFAHQDSGFGITSDFWDKIFDTCIVLRKLDFPLRWISESGDEES